MQEMPMRGAGRAAAPRTFHGALSFIGLLVALLVAIDYPVLAVLIVALIAAGPRVPTRIGRAAGPDAFQQPADRAHTSTGSSTNPRSGRGRRRRPRPHPPG